MYRARGVHEYFTTTYIPTHTQYYITHFVEQLIKRKTKRKLLLLCKATCFIIIRRTHGRRNNYLAVNVLRT